LLEEIAAPICNDVKEQCLVERCRLIVVRI
jgi:hypothetical protein